MRTTRIIALSAAVALCPAFFCAIAQEKERVVVREIQRIERPERQDTEVERREVRGDRRIIVEVPGDAVGPPERDLRFRELERWGAGPDDPEKRALMEKIETMESASTETSRKYRQTASEEEKAKLETDLIGIVDQLFDLKIKLEELQQKRLEEQAAKLEERIKKRKENREKIIKLRLEELMGKSDFLKW